MSIHHEELNSTIQMCHNCGGNIEPGRGQRVEEWGYPWDGSDTEGSITEKLDEWYEHFTSEECLTAACASGHNLDYLLWWVHGCKGSGFGRPANRLANMARAAYNAHARGNRELAEMIARGEEGAMREAGWGGIGGSQGRGE